jgi:transposase
MKYAQILVLPQTPPGGLTAGIDWASADHVVCVVDAAGQVRARFSVTHDRVGIGKLIAGLRAAGVSEAAIERSDGVLVGALLDAGLTVVVITSRQMKNLRSRYGSAGAKDDRFDAFVLADVLRTDRARLRPLASDMPATITLRAAVRARRDLVAHRIAACNQLRAHLAAAFPAGAGLFARLDSQISLAFLACFGSQDAAGMLSEADLAAWLQTLPHRGKAPRPEQLRARLQAAPRGATGADGAARAVITGALVATLSALASQVKALEARSAPSSPPTPTRTSSPACPGPAHCARHVCWPRPETAGYGSPIPSRWRAWPESPRSPAGPASTSRSASGGRSTASSATRSATSPATPATPAPGPRPSTTPPAPAAKTTRTPCASWPAPGST